MESWGKSAMEISAPCPGRGRIKPLSLLRSIKPWCVLVLNIVCSPAAPLQKGYTWPRKEAEEGRKDHQTCANSFSVKNKQLVEDPFV